MTSEPDGADGSDDRGRTVVWTAGSPDVDTRRPARPVRGVWGWAAIAVVAVLAGVTAFVLAYAVHTVVALAPSSGGTTAPLWLPEQLPADDHPGPPSPR